jgi:hypothetical protein
MASAKELVSESEPAVESTGTGHARLELFFATGKFRPQRESCAPKTEANKIAAAFPPAIRSKSVAVWLCEARIARRATATADALLRRRLRWDVCVVSARRPVQAAPF